MRQSTTALPAPASVMRPPRNLYYGWVLVMALGLTTIISYGTSQYLFGVLVVPMGRDLGWQRADLSGAYALSTLLAGLLGVPIGRLVDRHGARLALTTGSALAGCSLLGLSAVHTLWQFYLLWAGGLGLAGALTLYPVTFTVVANWFAHRRGSAFGLLTLLGGLASPIFVPLAGTLVLHLGWRTTLVVLGLVQLGIALPLHAFAVRRHPEDFGLYPDGMRATSGTQTSQRSGQTLHAAVRTLPFWTLTGAFALSGLAAEAVLVHAVAYLIGRGYSETAAASIVGAVGLASLPGRFLLNVLSDRIGPQRLLSLSLLTQAAGVLLLLHGTSLGWLIAYVVVYGAAFGAISPLQATVMANFFGRRAFGSITALQGVPVGLCAAAGPLVAGMLYDRFANYQIAFSLCIGAFLLAAVAVALTPRSPST